MLATTAPKLQVENLSCGYHGQMILEHLNMSVRCGEFVAVLGPSGCGKSTLLNILAGVLPPDGGRVLVDGKEVSGLSSHFAYMPQQDLLMPWQTIINNVCIYGAIHGRRRESRQAALQNMAKFGLSGYEERYPDELSGGMRQRAAFLRTALCTAEIMLLDEPFGALDVITRGDMQDWLSGMRSELARTTVLVTHDIDEAIYLADRILLLYGRPASFKKEIMIPPGKKNRDWLFAQTGLRSQIYHYLKEAL